MKGVIKVLVAGLLCAASFGCNGGDNAANPSGSNPQQPDTNTPATPTTPAQPQPPSQGAGAPVTPPGAGNPVIAKPVANGNPVAPSKPVAPVGPVAPPNPAPATPTALEGTWTTQCEHISGFIFDLRYVRLTYTVQGNQSYSVTNTYTDSKCTKADKKTPPLQAWATIQVGQPDPKTGLTPLDSTTSSGGTTYFDVFEIKGDTMMTGDRATSAAQRPTRLDEDTTYTRQATPDLIPPLPGT